MDPGNHRASYPADTESQQPNSGGDREPKSPKGDGFDEKRNIEKFLIKLKKLTKSLFIFENSPNDIYFQRQNRNEFIKIVLLILFVLLCLFGNMFLLFGNWHFAAISFGGLSVVGVSLRAYR